jgi:hypothetical protein
MLHDFQKPAKRGFQSFEKLTGRTLRFLRAGMLRIVDGDLNAWDHRSRLAKLTGRLAKAISDV